MRLYQEAVMTLRPTAKLTDHRKNGHENGPMQAIVRLMTVNGSDFELLACGHLQRAGNHFGGRQGRCQRRRCAKCKEGVPADVAPGDFFRQPGDCQESG